MSDQEKEDIEDQQQDQDDSQNDEEPIDDQDDENEDQPDGDDDGNDQEDDNPPEEEDNVVESPEPPVTQESPDQQPRIEEETPDQQPTPSPDGRSPEEENKGEDQEEYQEADHDEHHEGDMDDDQHMDDEQYQQIHEEESKIDDIKHKHHFDSIDTDEFVMPGVFDVPIKLADNQIKVVSVEVEKATKEMAYIGGYVNRRNGKEYHNFFTQTDQQSTYHPQKLTREVQTYQYNTKSSVMMREFGTQMEKPGLFIDNRKDKVIKPKPYFSSDKWKKQRWDRTLYIQCQIRGWFARRKAADLRTNRNDKDLELLRKQEDLRKKEEETHKQEIERRMHPKKEKDFEILYEELEAWRLSETKKIKASTELKEEEKKAALQQLLYKETKILQQIDRLKITANVSNKEEKINKFLKAMSDPKLWTRGDERKTEVHTPFTTRAKELMDLYNGLKLPYLSIDERLDVLLHTKWTVREFDCNLTREIVDLIDREADMLNRGRSVASLEGLRKRLANLFLQFIETPEFNPEAARFQKVPRELLKQTQSIIFE